MPCLAKDHCSKEVSRAATTPTQSICPLNRVTAHPAPSQPDSAHPGSLPADKPGCLSQGSLPHLSHSMTTSQLFSNLPVPMTSTGSPISQFPNTLLSFSNTPQSTPSGTNSLPAFSQTLPASTGVLVFPLPSQILSLCLRITQLLVPAHSSVCLVSCLLHIHLRLLPFKKLLERINTLKTQESFSPSKASGKSYFWQCNFSHPSYSRSKHWLSLRSYQHWDTGGSHSSLHI